MDRQHHERYRTLNTATNPTLTLSVTKNDGCACRRVRVATSLSEEPMPLGLLCKLPQELVDSMELGRAYAFTVTEYGTVTARVDGNEPSRADQLVLSWLRRECLPLLEQLQAAARVMPVAEVLHPQIAKAIEMRLHHAVMDRNYEAITTDMLEIAPITPPEILEREIAKMGVTDANFSSNMDAVIRVLFLGSDATRRLDHARATMRHPRAIAVEVPLPSNNPFRHIVEKAVWEMGTRLLNELMPKMLKRVAKRMQKGTHAMNAALAQVAADVKIMDGGHVEGIDVDAAPSDTSSASDTPKIDPFDGVETDPQPAAPA